MRKTLRRLTICLALTTFSLAVHAQSNNNKGATPVEVENGPNNPVPVEINNPVPVEINKTVVWRIIGVSDRIDDGQFEYAGIRGTVAMNQACVDTFGLSARAATIEDLMATTDAAVFAYIPGPPTNAWLVPGSVPLVVYTNVNSSYFVLHSSTGESVGRNRDESARRALDGAFCSNFLDASSGKSGAVVTSIAAVGNSPCDVARPVACATPVSVDIQ